MPFLFWNQRHDVHCFNRRVFDQFILPHWRGYLWVVNHVHVVQVVVPICVVILNEVLVQFLLGLDVLANVDLVDNVRDDFCLLTDDSLRQN